MAVTGKFSELRRLIRLVGAMANPSWRAGLSNVAAEAAREELARSFAEGVDPWDRPWKPSMRAVLEGGQTLSDTGRLRRSFTHRAWPDGFAIGTNVLYAATHQYGATITPKRAKALRFRLPGGRGKRKGGKGRWVTVKQVQIPARPFIPEPKLSPRWKNSIERAIRGYIDAHL